MQTLHKLLAGLLALTVLAACNATQLVGQPGNSGMPMPTAGETSGVTEPPGATTEPATSTPIPTPPPAMSAWPLAADLFYLNEAGQVWRLPLHGDETAATAATPLDLTVRDFAAGPGGNWLAYRTDAAITLTSLDGRPGRVVAPDVGLPDMSALTTPGSHSLRWAPNAGMLAYLTPTGFDVLVTGAGEQTEGLIYSVQEQALAGLSWSLDSAWLLVQRSDTSAALYSLDPFQRQVELGRINGYAWLADGRLAFAPAEGGLALITPSDVGSRVFVVSQDRPVTLPVQRQDGTLVFFLHEESPSEPGTLHAANPSDLSFYAESSVPVQTARLVWEPGGRRLLGQGDPPSTLWLLDPVTGSQAIIEPPGTATRLDWSDPPPRSVTGLTLPADLFFLAPQAGITQIWRLPASGAPAQAITVALENISGFDIAPDGTQVVYTSAGRIWRMSLDALTATEVATLSEQVLTPSASPAFSPDGQQIAYANGGIWTVDLETGEALRRVTDRVPPGTSDKDTTVYDQPRWSPDGAWLLARVTYYEGSDLALISLAQDPNRRPPPAALNLFGAQAEWGPDGRVYVYSDGGTYGDPYVTIVQPGDPPVSARVLNLPVIDAQVQPDGRIALLRVPVPSTGGPTTVKVYSIAANGTDLQAASEVHMLEGARLSPDALLIAGLIQPRVDEFGGLTGRLAIADTSTGDMFVIEGVTDAHDLRWGP